MGRPLISCLLITYNQEDYVSEALQSIFAQTYSPLEIVVSDDASADRTYAKLERLVKAYAGPHRVVLRRNPVRRNVVGHLADAIPHTKGELIVVAAGDDVSLPDRVERIVAAWEQTGRRAHALNSDLQAIDEHGTRSTVQRGGSGLLKMGLGDIVDRATTFFGASAAYSRAVFERFGALDPFNIFEDQVLPFRAALLGEVVTIPETLVLWRRLSRSNSMQYLHRPRRAKERRDKLLYQQQQQVSYQRQRLADIDALRAASVSSGDGADRIELVGKLRQRLATVEAASGALQSRFPAFALAGETLKGKLSLKQAARLFTLYRWPALTDWWFDIRMRQA